MHSNNFVLAVKGKDQRVLREVASKVYLPFHSEYSLLLKNNNDVRSCCAVYIDGTDVLGGDELIISPNSSMDLNRFLVDRNMNNGRRFKFVPLSDGRVADPSSPENGLIEVKFWKERQEPTYVTTTWPYTPPDKYHPPYYPPNGPVLMGSLMSKGINSSVVGLSGISGQSMNCYSADSGAMGATVEGGRSNQSFTTASFGKKDGSPTILRLTMVGRPEALTVHKTKHLHCPKCGKSNAYNNKFCVDCGRKLARAKLELA